MKGVNSTLLGSTIKNRSSSGGLVNRREAMIELMQTLLPLPVAPAINMWGRAARSNETGAPPASCPIAMGSPFLATRELKDWLDMTSRRWTLAGEGLGTSSPTSPSPGMGASIRR